MKTKHVRVLRAFYFNGEPTKVNEKLELPHTFALEMIAAKKAEAVDNAAKPAEENTTKDDGKPGKGGKHAG